MSNEVKTLIGIAVVTIAIVVGAAFLVGGKASPTAETQPLTEEQTQKLIREDSYSKGAKNAKITIVEFGDYQCPACRDTYPIVEQILKEYPNDIKFVFREFPLPSHQHARLAANAAQAAGAQGKYYDMYGSLYQTQTEWTTTKDPMSLFETYAKNIGLDVEQFTQDVKDKKYDDKVQEGINDGYAVGVQATPTFFINGEYIRGGLPYDQLKARIEAILNEGK
ncbi:MAG TPA: thioredoxin domain-containing protein [Patescibacteria group bacterium]|nr:thioredoxin domain-containing protein [Patescibacteria group bacterium]